MAIQQLSGIDAVLYYAPTLFSQAGLSSTTSSFLLSGVSRIVMVVITFCCQWFQDKWIRRTQMIGGSAFNLSLALQQHRTRGGHDYLLHLHFYRRVHLELSHSSSLGQCANWVVNCVVAFSTPLFLNRSTWGPYFLFGGCSLFNAVVCFAFQPETKGLTLEAIDSGFEDTPFQSAMRRRIGNLQNRGNNTTGNRNQSTSTAIELVEVSTK
ncbi:hypothetical protein DFS33DRAFT_1378288 [Desarmillaria ectypa]|nr:hypothetical protein DFS33DRAFT_1378288 [Desarmillaria ectypa]